MKDKPEIKNFLNHVDAKHHGEYIETCKECRRLVQKLRYNSADERSIKEVIDAPCDDFLGIPDQSNYILRTRIAKSKIYRNPSISNIEVAKKAQIPLSDVQKFRERLMILGLIPIEIINSNDNYIERLKYAKELIQQKHNQEIVLKLSGLQQYEYDQLIKNILNIDKTFKQTRIYYNKLIKNISLEFLVFLKHFLNVDKTYFIDEDNNKINLKQLISKKLLSHVIDTKGNIIIPKAKINKADGFWKLQILLIRYAEISNQSVSYLFTQPTINDYNHLYKQDLYKLSYNELFNAMYQVIYNEWLKRKKNGVSKYKYTYKNLSNIINFMYRDKHFKQFKFVISQNGKTQLVTIKSNDKNVNFKKKYHKVPKRKCRLKHGE